jgi:DNA-directed RNA polymerase specialized sigma24 family protein
MPEAKHVLSPSLYASSGDFCRVFYEDTDRLYRLAFLLTVDRAKAEQCLVSGLEDAVNGNPVFKEWARSWARRVVIQNAVRAINPRPSENDAQRNSNNGDKSPTAEPAETAAILELPPFERFVYVMSVLEHYSDQDCSVLLGCARRDVMAGRIRALRQIEPHSAIALNAG